jgi:hypothetical protein
MARVPVTRIKPLPRIEFRPPFDGHLTVTFHRSDEPTDRIVISPARAENRNFRS